MKPKLAPVSKVKPEARETILWIKNLRKVFRTNGSFLTVLDDVHFYAKSGEMICIFGRSGCGKSTLLKILAGFLTPSSGTVLLNGNPVTIPGPDRCVVFQEDTLFPWLTVKENIAFGLRGRIRDKKAIWEEVEHFLSLVGLSEFRDYLPREISGGMKQRVALARVLILKPQVLLMDEPTRGIDVGAKSEIFRIMRELCNTGVAIIMFSSELPEVLKMSDRILVMHDGTIVKELDPSTATQDQVLRYAIGEGEEQNDEAES